MSCQPLDGEEEEEEVEQVESGGEVPMDDVGTSAPRTPKRDVPVEAEQLQTPAKTRRNQEPEPTNNDLLLYMKNMFEHNREHMSKLERRFDVQEKRKDQVEDGYKRVAAA